MTGDGPSDRGNCICDEFFHGVLRCRRCQSLPNRLQGAVGFNSYRLFRGKPVGLNLYHLRHGTQFNLFEPQSPQITTSRMPFYLIL